MYDCYMIVAEAFKNVEKDGQVSGYQFGLRIPFFSGVVVSLVGRTELSVDGETVPEEAMSITLRGQTYPKTALVNDPVTRWEFGETGIVTVFKPGGLSKGEHTIDVRQEVLIGWQTGGIFGH
ncbi:MAG: DUF6379 domain-containing protein, partial [Anaerolineales bacterium]